MTARPRPESEERVPWEDLLCTEGSLLASVATAGLDGLRGTLRAALAAAPTDRGADACTTLLDALDRLLAETGHTASVHAGFPQGGVLGVGGARYGTPGGGRPGVGAPWGAGPGVGEPRVAGPGVEGPGVAEPRVAGPGVAGPQGGRPGVAGPEGGGPHAEAPSYGLPQTGIPHAEPPAGTSHAGTPRYGSPQAENPPYESRRAEVPPYGAPQAGIPQTGSPPADCPPAGSPQAESPQTRSPQTGTPHTGALHTGTPQTGSQHAGSPQTGGHPNDPTAPRVPPRPAAPPRTSAPAILTLAAELAGSPEVGDFAAGAVPPASDGPGGTDGVRRWYHLTLLRLPDRHVGVWRARAAEADPAAQGAWETRRGWADEVLLPPSGDGRPGLRTVRDKVTEPSDLAGLVLALHEYDEALCLLLDRVWTGGSTRLTDPQVSLAYRTELTKRLESLERSPRGSTERLRASVAVDEALCSVTHLPPGAPGSWWNRLAEESHAAALDLCRQLLAAGRNVEVVLPARPYRQARHHTRATDDIRLGVGGRPGDTLACLRLWLRVDDQEFPGRVVHRGQE